MYKFRIATLWFLAILIGKLSAAPFIPQVLGLVGGLLGPLFGGGGVQQLPAISPIARQPFALGQPMNLFGLNLPLGMNLGAVIPTAPPVAGAPAVQPTTPQLPPGSQLFLTLNKQETGLIDSIDGVFNSIITVPRALLGALGNTLKYTEDIFVGPRGTP